MRQSRADEKFAHGIKAGRQRDGDTDERLIQVTKSIKNFVLYMIYQKPRACRAEVVSIDLDYIPSGTPEPSKATVLITESVEY